MWPYEGEVIEVEVQASDDAPPVWVASEVLMVLVDGQFQARIALPDGSDQWEDWFSWQDEGTDWRRGSATGKKRKALLGTSGGTGGGGGTGGDLASAEEAAASTEGGSEVPPGWRVEERTTATGRKYVVCHGPHLTHP